tara:strand:- start:264 stop:1175 length:912 start_codon:yes stop_codon:yes gene_type:complete
MTKQLLFWIIIFYSSIGFSQLNDSNDITILKKLTLEEINYSLKSETEYGTFLTGITCDFSVWGECTALVYKNFAGSWSLKDKLTFSNTNGEIENFLSNENLVYFGSHSAGGSSGNGSYYFNAYSFKDGKFYSLEYSWSDYNYSSYGFSNIDEIENKTVLSFFEQKASESEYVYKPSNELTLDEHWKIDNKDIYEKIFKDKTEIKFRYTKNPPYEFEEKTAENKDYIIYNLFKNNLYGYKKKTKEYFIIWIPSWFYDTTVFMFLDDEDNSVGIQDSTLGTNGARVYINLDAKEVYAFYKSNNED